MGEITHIFGYGSLMYPSGINGRGMSYNYTWKDLSTAMLLDYRRGMFAYYMNNYYGIMETKGYMVYGAIFKIHSDADLESLMINEGASEIYRDTEKGLMYEVVDVTNKLLFPIKRGRKVIALVNTEDKSGCGKITKSYIRSVYKGIQPWGPDFMDIFLLTGGMQPTNPLSGIIPLYKVMKIAKRAFLALKGMGEMRL